MFSGETHARLSTGLRNLFFSRIMKGIASTPRINLRPRKAKSPEISLCLVWGVTTST